MHGALLCITIQAPSSASHGLFSPLPHTTCAPARALSLTLPYPVAKSCQRSSHCAQVVTQRPAPSARHSTSPVPEGPLPRGANS